MSHKPCHTLEKFGTFVGQTYIGASRALLHTSVTPFRLRMNWGGVGLSLVSGQTPDKKQHLGCISASTLDLVSVVGQPGRLGREPGARGDGRSQNSDSKSNRRNH